MFCTNCGASIPEGTMFCTNCGTALTAAATPQAQPYQQPSYTKQAQTVTKQQPADQQAQYQQPYQQQPADPQAQYQQPYQQPQYQQPNQGQSYQQQPYQGQYQQPYQGQGYAPASSKSKVAAGLFAIFLGSLGVHKFYLGYTKAAVIMLVVTLVGALFVIGPLVMGIIGLIEGILYLTKTDQEFYDVYIAGQKEWF